MSLAFKHYRIILGATLLAGCVVERPSEPVSNPVLNSITISPATANLTVNASIQLTATLRDVNGAVLSGDVSWSSDAGAIASVSAAGLVRGNEVGSATITATSGGKTASLVVPVAAHAGYYVAPAGSASGNGSWNRPWDLASALAGANAMECTHPSSRPQRRWSSSQTAAASSGLVPSSSSTSGWVGRRLAIIFVMLITRPKLVSTISAPAF